MRQSWIFAAILLAACASEEQVNVQRADDGVESVPADESSANQISAVDREVNEPLPERPGVGGPSQWFTRTRQGDAWTGYGPPNSEAVLSLRCDRRAGRIVFNTTAMPPEGPGSTTMQLRAPGVDQTLSARASDEGLPSTEASVVASTDWLARLASASGTLTVRVGESEPVVAPVTEALTSLIRDCRG